MRNNFHFLLNFLQTKYWFSNEQRVLCTQLDKTKNKKNTHKQIPIDHRNCYNHTNTHTNSHELTQLRFENLMFPFHFIAFTLKTYMLAGVYININMSGLTITANTLYYFQFYLFD